MVLDDKPSRATVPSKADKNNEFTSGESPKLLGPNDISEEKKSLGSKLIVKILILYHKLPSRIIM
jgi:hypothetical protein